jgi:hypothetical protein
MLKRTERGGSPHVPRCEQGLAVVGVQRLNVELDHLPHQAVDAPRRRGGNQDEIYVEELRVAPAERKGAS